MSPPPNGAVAPLDGSSGAPRCWAGITATRRISIRPSQKPGTATPATDRVVSAWSSRVPRRSAETTPTGTENRTARTIAVSVSSSVLGSRSSRWVVTGVPSIIERPKSPCRTFHTQTAYWTGHGWSRPYSWRSACTAADESRGSSVIPGT